MNVYALVLFLHFLGMAALFIGYGLELTASGLLRGAATGDQARAWLRIYRVSLPVSGPALALLILSGGFLGAVTGLSKEGWVLVSFAGILVALFIGFGLLMRGSRRSVRRCPRGMRRCRARRLRW